MLKFDAEMTKLFDQVYQGGDVIKRRRATYDALAAAPGETIVDIGCGNGLLTAELARAVGPKGQIFGVDPSADMRAAAQDRCRDYEHVTFIEGSADPLPLDDNSVDKAVSVQVFEYIPDIEAAMWEAMRALKPGGRLVISDLHFGTLAWHSAEPERMARMIASWDKHFVWRDVPARLPGMIEDAGHLLDDIRSVTINDHHLKPDGLAQMMMILMRQFAIDNDHLPAEEAHAWYDEQVALAQAGRFFFSLTQFVIVARKAG